MKAPISKKIKEILANEADSEELVQSAIVNEGTEGSIKLSGKKYQLHRVVSYIKH